MRPVRVTRYAPRLPHWPAVLKLRIVVLTDLHACVPFMDAARIRTICGQANALEPDIILLLGDYGTGPRFSRALAPAAWAAELERLAAPLGVHAILGNHDYDGNASGDSITAAQPALEAVGIPVYINRAGRTETASGAFWLAGLGDQFAFQPRRSRSFDKGQGVDDLAGTLAQVTTEEPIILMAHEPDLFPDTPARVALTLSGHTHGGQVKLFSRTPVVPSRHGSQYVHGHIVEEDRHLIVSAGLGYSGLPIRFGAPAEIVQIDLGGTA